jgi:16S rRNA (cytosine1402-N4)-methyltransferase
MYHLPVMLRECIEGLKIKPDGVYVDVTFGGGGHSKVILQQLGDTGKLLVFDQDPDAKTNAEAINDPRLVFIDANFRHLKKYLRLYGVKAVDGILGDLGVSSHQFDTAERGFSTRFEATLDMRMNPRAGRSALEILNDYSSEDLHKILGMYGELQNARTAAQAIVLARNRKSLKTVNDLKEALKSCTPRGKENKYWAQVFQALRIEVNDEMESLQEFLTQTPEILNPEGRLVVMAYHSLEDRLVKNYINKGKFFGEVEKDLFGNEIKPLRGITRKPIEPSADEIAQNPRSRSAKLRIATPMPTNV